MRQVCAAIVALTLLAGCATTYQKSGFSGGYSETQLGENIFQVSFKGNAKTSAERASDFCLLRCSELALMNGFNYFIIVDAKSSAKTSTFTTPTTSKTTGSARTIGGYTYGRAKTTTSGGETFIFTKPRANNTIVCFTEKPESEGLVFEAVFVANSIRGKYNMKAPR